MEEIEKRERKLCGRNFLLTHAYKLIHFLPSSHCFLTRFPSHTFLSSEASWWWWPVFFFLSLYGNLLLHPPRITSQVLVTHDSWLQPPLDSSFLSQQTVHKHKHLFPADDRKRKGKTKWDGHTMGEKKGIEKSRNVSAHTLHVWHCLPIFMMCLESAYPPNGHFNGSNWMAVSPQLQRNHQKRDIERDETDASQKGSTRKEQRDGKEGGKDGHHGCCQLPLPSLFCLIDFNDDAWHHLSSTSLLHFFSDCRPPPSSLVLPWRIVAAKQTYARPSHITVTLNFRSVYVT